MQEELEKEGIWDFDRLSKPYVQKKFLEVSFPSHLLLSAFITA